MALPTANLIEWFGGANATGYHRRTQLTPVNSPTHAAGKIGNGFQASSASGGRYWIIPNADASRFAMGTGAHSVSFWVNPDAVTGGHRGAVSFGGDDSTKDAGLDIRITSNGTGILVYFSDGTTSYGIAAGSVLTAGILQHVCVTVNRAGNMILYVNGSSVGTKDVSAASAININPPSDLRIGRTDQGQLSDHLIDEVSFWSTELSSAQVGELYASGDAAYYYQIIGTTDVHFPLDHEKDIRGQAWADLASVGTTAFVAGKVGNCLSLSGAGRLEGNNAVFEYIRDEYFSIDGWVSMASLAANQGIAGQTNNGYNLQYLTSSGKLRWRVNTAGGVKTIDHSTVLSADTWVYVHAGHDPVNNTIFLSLNNGTPQTTATGGDVPVPQIEPFTIGSVGTSQLLSGKVDELRFRRGSALSSGEVTAAYNSGAGAALKTELEMDYAPAASGAKKVYIEGYASQVGGSGTHTGHQLLITDAVLKTNNPNMFDSGHADVATRGSFRFSIDEAGAQQVAGHVPFFESNATPANGKLEAYTRRPTNDGGSDAGNGVYVWWFPGSAKEAPPNTAIYGRNAVRPSTYRLNLPGGGYEDATKNGNNATPTNVTLSSDVPYGHLQSFDFNGVSSRMNVPDSDSLDLADGTSFTLLAWMITDSETGTFQGLMSKRQNLVHNYGAFFIADDASPNPGTFHANFYNGAFRGVTMNFDPNFAKNTWMPVFVEFEDVGTDYTIRIYNATTLVNSATVTQEPLPNAHDLVIGCTQTGVGVYGEWMDGRQKGIRIIAEILSADVKNTIVNNESDNAAFWNGQWVYTDADGDGKGSAGTDRNITFAIADSAEVFAATLARTGSIDAAIQDSADVFAATLSRQGALSMNVEDSADIFAATLAQGISRNLSLSAIDSPDVFSGSMERVGALQFAIVDSPEVFSASLLHDRDISFGITDSPDVFAAQLSQALVHRIRAKLIVKNDLRV